jgi:hypothetical protein
MATESASEAAMDLSAENLAQRTFHRRAVEAVIWGIPTVNFYRIYQAMVHDLNAAEGK